MSSLNKILLVDDEEDIIEFLSYNLEKEGYVVESCNNGIDAIEKAKVFNPDLIILDIMMPKMDGIEACEEIRKIPELDNAVIAFLSARSEDYVYVAGLNAGADDFITKPIKPRVLVSKVKSLLRRKNNKITLSETVKEDNDFASGNIIIDRERYIVIKDSEEISLPKKEFELIALLASNPNKVFSREEIFNKIWQDTFVNDRTIDVHIRRIRSKIGKDIIRTTKGVGYKFVS